MTETAIVRKKRSAFAAFLTASALRSGGSGFSGFRSLKFNNKKMKNLFTEQELQFNF